MCQSHSITSCSVLIFSNRSVNNDRSSITTDGHRARQQIRHFANQDGSLCFPRPICQRNSSAFSLMVVRPGVRGGLAVETQLKSPEKPAQIVPGTDGFGIPALAATELPVQEESDSMFRARQRLCTGVFDHSQFWTADQRLPSPRTDLPGNWASRHPGDSSVDILLLYAQCAIGALGRAQSADLLEQSLLARPPPCSLGTDQ